MSARPFRQAGWPALAVLSSAARRSPGRARPSISMLRARSTRSRALVPSTMRRS
jgi:hypothetical protein